ncbi:MAG: YqcI/YcgG family protein [Ktedonobacteraceae bacterium]
MESSLFSHEMSGYGQAAEDGTFLSTYPLGSSMYDFHTSSHSYFKQLVSDEHFTCLAGRTVARTNQYAYCAYPDMTDACIAEGILHDLIKFSLKQDHEQTSALFRSFVAAFRDPQIANPLAGAECLYTLLRNMDEKNSQHFGWAEGFSHDTDSSSFGYSAGGEAFFLAYFYPTAYWAYRRSDVTFVVFNAHKILQKLRELGRFAKLRDKIRGRQKEMHPLLGDHGTCNEWLQYTLLSPDPVTQAEELRIRQSILGACPFHRDTPLTSVPVETAAMEVALGNK